MVTGALVDCGLWRMSLALLQGRRGSQGVEEFPEPLRDHVLVGIGHVAPVLGLLQHEEVGDLSGGLVEHLPGSGRHGVGGLDEGWPGAGPRIFFSPVGVCFLFTCIF